MSKHKNKFLLTSILSLIAFPLLTMAQISFISEIPKKGAKVENFVPKNCTFLYKGEGDFNKDGQQDVVMVLKTTEEDDESNYDEYERLLIILFKTESGYELSAVSAKAILCIICGGVYGDPFQDITIKGNSFIIHHYGGSRDRWGCDHQFRYQQNDWYLIGSKSISEDALEGTSYTIDHNLLTGDIIEERVSENGEKDIIKKKVAKKTLKKLSAFDIHYDIE